MQKVKAEGEEMKPKDNLKPANDQLKLENKLSTFY